MFSFLPKLGYQDLKGFSSYKVFWKFLSARNSQRTKTKWEFSIKNRFWATQRYWSEKFPEYTTILWRPISSNIVVYLLWSRWSLHQRTRKVPNDGQRIDTFLNAQFVIGPLNTLDALTSKASSRELPSNIIWDATAWTAASHFPCSPAQCWKHPATCWQLHICANNWKKYRLLPEYEGSIGKSCPEAHSPLG